MFKSRSLIVVVLVFFICPLMTFADSGFSGQIEVTAPVFSLPANTVKAPINDIILSGNSLNQLVKNGNFSDGTNNYSSTRATLSVVSGRLKVESSVSGESYASQDLSSVAVSGHKYYIRGWTEGDGTGYARIRLVNKKDDGSYQDTSFLGSTSLTYVSGIFTIDSVYSTPTCSIRLQVDSDVGAYAYFDDVMVFDLTALGLDDKTTDELDDMIPHYLAYGVKSTNPGVIKSIGKNQCPTDPSDWEQGYLNTSTGAEAFSTTYIRTKNYYRIKPNTTFVQSRATTEKPRVFYYDINKNFISWENVITTFTTPVNCIYVRYFTLLQTGASTTVPDDITTIHQQIEEGTTATDYAKYEISEGYNPVELHNTPANKPCIFDYPKGIHIANNKKYVIQSSDITLNANLTNVSVYQIELSDKYVEAAGHHVIIPNKQYGLIGGVDSTDNIGHYYTSTAPNPTKVRVVYASGTSLATAQADLAGTSVIYQLATPQTFTYNTTPILSYENGTVIIQNRIKETKAYGTQINISNTVLPIRNMCKVNKIENGIITPVGLENITVDPNGLSFTISGAMEEEIYEYEYEYPQELSTVPTISYSVAINQGGQVSSNTEAIQRNSDLIDIILQQIQLIRQEIQGLKDMLQ